MIFYPDGIIPDSGLTGLTNTYIYIYIYGGVPVSKQESLNSNCAIVFAFGLIRLGKVWSPLFLQVWIK